MKRYGFVYNIMLGADNSQDIQKQSYIKKGLGGVSLRTIEIHLAKRMKNYFRPQNWLVLFLMMGWTGLGFAQQPANNWIERMQDPNEDFKTLQEDFNRYWEGRTDQKGNGYKVFRRWEYIHQTLVQPDGRLQQPEHVWREYNRYMRAWEAQSATARSAGGTWTSTGASFRCS